MERPEIGKIYRHYKGKTYKVVDIVRHSETLEEMVLYQPLYVSKDFPGQTWVRPLNMFLEEVVLNDKKIPRFKLIKS